ncbi:carboxypeptidase-like regulatory domain-containing protein [Pareuzebyella sediminis]|uniref:carboxypeptidase-like regulatory domain-containing protein n=1 Tax=Pareuzebyella sediminis TaxID=2607998 RepID=UPI0011EC96A6|nr:carboxypeptidase-like regulatory domain-containing protein [Pareuzebyella sediminis]
MEKAVRITIKNPCSEKFDTFKRTKKGGLCPQCQKEVIDFSMMSKTMITQKVSSKTHTICGRFKRNQLESANVSVGVTNESNFWPTRIGSLCFAVLTISASTSVQALESPSIISKWPAQVTSSGNIEFAPHQFYETYIVKGKVIDEDNLPLPGVSVVLKGSDIGVSTDLEGKFEFPKALKVGDILVFNYLGYDTKSYRIAQSENDTIDITIKFESSDIELMGEVSVEGTYKSKRNIFQKFVALFR